MAQEVGQAAHAQIEVDRRGKIKASNTRRHITMTPFFNVPDHGQMVCYSTITNHQEWSKLYEELKKYYGSDGKEPQQTEENLQ